MQLITKMLGTTEQRKSRFHTGRGQLLPVSAWPQLVSSAMMRVSHKQPESPWLAPSAVAFLDETIQPTWNVFEFGSGASTAWFAQRVNMIESVENDAEWHHQVEERLQREGVCNCKLTWFESSEAFPEYLETLPDASLDLAIVDGHEAWPGHRLECLKVARTKVKPGGLMVLDDSDRPEYRTADDLLPGWTAHRFVGVKPFPLATIETSIFVRPIADVDPSK
jgi:predicted O-methyltransferase YrrM